MTISVKDIVHIYNTQTSNLPKVGYVVGRNGDAPHLFNVEIKQGDYVTTLICDETGNVYKYETSFDKESKKVTSYLKVIPHKQVIKA